MYTKITLLVSNLVFPSSIIKLSEIPRVCMFLLLSKILSDLNMERYPLQEHVIIVTASFTNCQSVVSTQREYRHNFPRGRVTWARTINPLAARLV